MSRDVDLRRLDLKLFGDMLLNHGPFLSAAAAGTLGVGKRMIDAPAFQELREDDPLSSAARLRTFPGGPGRLVCGIVRFVRVRRAWFRAGGRHVLLSRRSQRLRLKERGLLRVGHIALATWRPEGLLQQGDLLGRLGELLVILREGRLQFGGQSLQLTVLLLQLVVALLQLGVRRRSRRAFRELVTSVFHACLDAQTPEFVCRIPKFFQNLSYILRQRRFMPSPTPATSHALQIDPLQEQRQVVGPHFHSGCSGAVPTLARRNGPRDFEGPPFQSFVKNDHSITHELQHLDSVSTSIEKQEQLSRLDVLSQVLFDDAAQSIETLAHVGRSQAGKHLQRSGPSQHAPVTPRANSHVNCAAARISVESPFAGMRTTMPPGSSTAIA